jgi:RsmE family RNA methyltransferase
VNLILFEPAELAAPLPRTDQRAEHILKVLRRQIGDTFDVGLVDGPLGKGTLVATTDAALTLTFTWGHQPPPADPITLLLGLPRPQTARDILRDATTLGVGALHFVATERSDPNYAAATLWTSGEWRRHCLAGAAQAFATRLPAVTSDCSLATALAALPAAATRRLALDNYEATCPLSECHILGETPVVLALGPERGWGPADRAALRAHGFTLVHLGTRVLRSETAVIAALTLVRARLGLL